MHMICAQKAIHASRPCPLHQDLTQPNPIENRPEDFLATDVQKDVCDEVLRRAVAGRWEDVPDMKPDTRNDRAKRGREREMDQRRQPQRELEQKREPDRGREHKAQSQSQMQLQPSNVSTQTQDQDVLMDTIMDEDDDDGDGDDAKTVTGEWEGGVPAHAHAGAHARVPTTSGCGTGMIPPVLLGGPLDMQTCRHVHMQNLTGAAGK